MPPRNGVPASIPGRQRADRELDAAHGSVSSSRLSLPRLHARISQNYSWFRIGPRLNRLIAPRVARYTWSRQWYALGLIGMSVGIFHLTPFLIRRDLGASPWQVAMLIGIWQAPWILAPLIEPLMARLNPQRAWRWLAVIAHAPLLVIAFVPLAWPLMIVLGLYYLTSIAYIPHRGAMIRANYAPEVRGRMYGLLQAVTLLGSAVAAKAAGRLIEWDSAWIRVVFPVGGVLGFLGFWAHSRIRWRGQARVKVARLHASWHEVWRILRDDRAFRTYEVGFMTYGVAFLMGWPLLFLYAEGPLGLTYDQLTNGTAYASPAALLFGAWFWSRFTDRLGVVRLSMLAFLCLAIFYTSMLFVTGPWSFVAVFALWGFSMAAVDVSWSLGPLHFAPEGEAHMYAAVHFSMVGVRSLFAPFLGFWIKQEFGYSAAFSCCATLFCVAAIIALRLSRRSP